MLRYRYIQKADLPTNSAGKIDRKRLADEATQLITNAEIFGQTQNRSYHEIVTNTNEIATNTNEIATNTNVSANATKN